MNEDITDEMLRYIGPGGVNSCKVVKGGSLVSRITWSLDI